MAYLDIDMNITSTIKKINGTTESGPSTSLNSTVRSLESYNSIRKIMEDAVDELHRESFSSRFRSGFLETFSEIYTDPPWGEAKVRITYHLRVHITGEDFEGYPVDRYFSDDYERSI